MTRQGVLVEPYRRLKLEQVEQIHQASLVIIADLGVMCFNRDAADIFGDHGVEVSSIDQGSAACWLLKIPLSSRLPPVKVAPSELQPDTPTTANINAKPTATNQIFFIVYLLFNFSTYI